MKIDFKLLMLIGECYGECYSTLAGRLILGCMLFHEIHESCFARAFLHI